MEGIERTNTRAISEVVTSGTKSKVMKMKKGNDFPDSSIRGVQEVGLNKVLISGPTKLILFDYQSGEVVSSCHYNLNLPVNLETVHFDKDLILGCCTSKEMKQLEVFKFDPGLDEGVPFKHLGILDLSIFRQFYSLKRVVSVCKVSEDYYEAILSVQWIQSYNSPIVDTRLLYLNFEASLSPKGIPCLRIVQVHPFFTLNDIPSWVYKQAGQWCLISQSAARARGPFQFLQSKSKWVVLSSNEARGRVAPLTIIFGKISERFNDAHIYRKYFFIEKYRGEKKVIKLHKFGKIGQNGEVKDLFPINSVEIDLSSRVYFDEGNDSMKIFCFVEQPDLHSFSLKIFNWRLELTTRIKLTGINTVYICGSIDSSRIDLIGKLSPLEPGPPPQSLILDLEQKVVRKIDGEDGDGILRYPKVCSDGRLICFTKNYDCPQFGLIEYTSGVFISE